MKWKVSFGAIKLFLLLDPQEFTLCNVETKDFFSLPDHCEGQVHPLQYCEETKLVSEFTFEEAVQAAF